MRVKHSTNSIHSLRQTSLVVLSLVVLQLFIHQAFAADISRDVRTGREDESIEHDGYLEIAFAAILNEMPIPGADNFIGTIGIGGHYRYKRFFIDAHAESYNQFQIGINAFSGDIWSIDLLGASSEHGIDSELNTELKLFTERSPASFLGVRATGYNGPYIFQFEGLQDISGVHDGSLVTATIARTWLYHNWNFHGLFGLRYESARSLDFQFGVDESEATDIYPTYTAGAGATFVTEFGVTYPLTEYLLLKSTFRWWELSSQIVDSPFIDGEGYATFSNSITFVY